MHTPPKSAQNNAAKVLRWRAEHPDEIQGMTAVGWTRARQLASGKPVSADVVKRMAQFARHRGNYEKAREKKSRKPWTEPAIVAWLGWGGTSGVNWALNESAKIRKGNPAMKKKSRKKNPQRVTMDWLKKRVALLNQMMGNPETAYTKKADGGLTGNKGHLYIDQAYGGYKLAQMAGNGTGEHDISSGYVSKKELNTFVDGMIAAVREMQSRGSNPAPRKKRATKKRAKKKTKRNASKRKTHIVFMGTKTGAPKFLWKQGNSYGLISDRSKAHRFPSLSAAKTTLGQVSVPRGMGAGIAESGTSTADIKAALSGK